MGRKRLSAQKERPNCIRCQAHQSKRNGKSKEGFIKYSKYCTHCEMAVYNQTTSTGRAFGYKLHKKTKCEKCGFVPEHPCQLDVDHIDGDCSNNEIKNLQTLCANCHRLKTYQDGNKKPS